ncbi:hypothetical protein [Janthinobacterium sp.]|uniref:hypothetical protein n=1 Tax=Janthinobacterium sp. TaxID=1871054 RepID=UPI00260D8462|nr:hypothetical protein [Janthinobacterium sp.]
MTALLHRLLSASRYHWARYQHWMNKLRLSGVRHELAGQDEIRKVLISAKIEAMIELEASGERVKQLGRAHREAQWPSKVKP